MNLAPINIPPPELNQSVETHNARYLMEALGAVLLVVLVGWLIFSPAGKSPTRDIGGDAVGPSPATKEEMFDQMTQLVPEAIFLSEKNALSEKMLQSASGTEKVSETSQATGPALVTTSAEKKKMFVEMSQKTSSAKAATLTGTVSGASEQTAPALMTTSAEREEMMKAMQQKIQ